MKKNFVMLKRIRSVMINDVLYTTMLSVALLAIGLSSSVAITDANLALNNTIDVATAWPVDTCKDGEYVVCC